MSPAVIALQVKASTIVRGILINSALGGRFRVSVVPRLDREPGRANLSECRRSALICWRNPADARLTSADAE